MGQEMLADLAVRISLAMPRGGYRLLAALSKLLPKLRKFPITMPVAPDVKLEADLAESVFFPLLKYGLYPHQVTEDLIVVAFLKEGDWVVDVGANIGYFSLLCADCIAGGVVHSFEPSATSFKYLRQVASQTKQVRPWQLAVSSSSGMLRFIDEAMSDLSHVADRQDRRGYLVECCTIDSWAAANKIERVDFIKVDTEGHEIHVIEGARGVIGLRQPVVEFEAIDMDAVQSVYDILQRQNSAAGYKIYRCHNQYPLSGHGGVAKTNNWFAIPDARSPVFPEFLFRRGFLASTRFGGGR